MLLLVQIDLSDANIAEFDAYEAAVQPLMAQYGGRIELCLRAIDGSSETHLLFFPDADAAAGFRNDPDRAAAQPLWLSCGARSTVMEVFALD